MRMRTEEAGAAPRPEAEAIAEVSREGCEAGRRITMVELGGAKVPVALDHGEIGVAEDVLRELDRRKGAPARPEGTTVLLELESFIAHVERNADESTVIYADTERLELTAIYDHDKTLPDRQRLPAWMAYRAVYRCPLAREWQIWTAAAKEAMGQVAFAQFLEDRFEDMTSRDGFPKPIEVLEMARNLEIRTQGTFKRKLDAVTGESELINKHEHGQESTKIHRSFLLGIPVFEGGDPYAVEARIRFQLRETGPAFGFTLHRQEEIARDAFGDVRKRVEGETKPPLLAGKPPVSRR